MTLAAIHVERLNTATSIVLRMLESYAQGDATTPRITDLGLPVEGSALDALAENFGLSQFELAVVVLAAGIEISPDVGNACAMAQGDPAMPYPTSLLALAVFAGFDGASQAAFAPTAPLRFSSLIAVTTSRPGARLQLHIGIPDTVLSFLIGQPVLDGLSG